MKVHRNFDCKTTTILKPSAARFSMEYGLHDPRLSVRLMSSTIGYPSVWLDCTNSLEVLLNTGDLQRRYDTNHVSLRFL